MAIVFNTSVLATRGLAFFSTATMNIALCNTTPLTRLQATSTGKCCAIGASTKAFEIKNAATHFSALTPKGRGVWVKKSTQLTVKKADSLKIKTLAIFGSTLVLVTKCSTRDYTTGDTINASSFAVIFYDASTAT